MRTGNHAMRSYLMCAVRKCTLAHCPLLLYAMGVSIDAPVEDVHAKEGDL